MRYLEWTHDPDPSDNSYTVDFAYLFREGDKTWCEYDSHILGQFPEAEWLSLMDSAGFTDIQATRYTEELEWFPGTPVFTGVKPD